MMAESKIERELELTCTEYNEMQTGKRLKL